MRKDKVKEIEYTVVNFPEDCLSYNKKHLREMINVYNLSETLFHQTYPHCDYNLEELRFYYSLILKQMRLFKSLTK